MVWIGDLSKIRVFDYNYRTLPVANFWLLAFYLCKNNNDKHVGYYQKN